MTSEIILTVWTVIPGSDSLKISFGKSPIVCKTTAFLPSLVKRGKKGGRQSINIHHNQHSEEKNLELKAGLFPLFTFPELIMAWCGLQNN